MKVNFTEAELTERFAVLLADNLAEEVLVEAEQIRQQAAKEKDGPRGPSSLAACSHFTNMAEREGFEPSIRL